MQWSLYRYTRFSQVLQCLILRRRLLQLLFLTTHKLAANTGDNNNNNNNNNNNMMTLVKFHGPHAWHLKKKLLGFFQMQASFSNCLGQLFSKIFNCFCVLLTLLVWLPNAWVSLCLDVFRDHQRKTDVKAKVKHTLQSALSTYLFPRKSISHDFCRAMFSTQREIKSASTLQQLPGTAVFEDLQLLLRSADAPGLSP